MQPDTRPIIIIPHAHESVQKITKADATEGKGKEKDGQAAGRGVEVRLSNEGGKEKHLAHSSSSTCATSGRVGDSRRGCLAVMFCNVKHMGDGDGD